MNKKELDNKFKITIHTKKKIKLGKRKCIKSNIQNLFGLPNLGNTCYMNSILQVILRNSFVKEIFLKNEFSKINGIYDLNNESYLSRILSTLIKQVYKNKKKILRLSSRKNEKILLREILLIMRTYSGNYDAETPYDPIIFFRDFLNHLINEGNSDKFLVNKLKNIFYGELENSIYCPICHNVDKFSEIFLDINCHNINHNLSSVNSVITQFLSEEMLENFFCEKCNTTSDIINKKEITKLPHLLTVANNYAEEINIEINIDIILKGKNFRLYGIILFNKITRHYISKIYVNNKFYYCDDMIIYDTFDESSYNPFILFYNLKL